MCAGETQSTRYSSIRLRNSVMLYVIGLGLCDEKDITIRLGSALRLQDLLDSKPNHEPV